MRLRCQAVAFGEAVPAAESEPVDVVTAAAGAARGARKRASIERVRASKTEAAEGGRLRERTFRNF